MKSPYFAGPAAAIESAIRRTFSLFNAPSHEASNASHGTNNAIDEHAEKVDVFEPKVALKNFTTIGQELSDVGALLPKAALQNFTNISHKAPDIGALLPKAALQNFTTSAKNLPDEFEGVLPASKKEVKYLRAKINQDDSIINKLVNQVNSLTPVRGLPNLIILQPFLASKKLFQYVATDC